MHKYRHRWRLRNASMRRHTYISTHAGADACRHTRACRHSHTHARVRLHTHACRRRYTQACMHSHTRLQAQARTHVQAHTHTHACMQAHAHMQAQAHTHEGAQAHTRMQARSTAAHTDTHARMQAPMHRHTHTHAGTDTGTHSHADVCSVQVGQPARNATHREELVLVLGIGLHVLLEVAVPDEGLAGKRGGGEGGGAVGKGIPEEGLGGGRGQEAEGVGWVYARGSRVGSGVYSLESAWGSTSTA